MQCPLKDLERKQNGGNSVCICCWDYDVYAQIYMRPYISFKVGMLGRYHSNLGLDSWKAAKKVLRYLQGTKEYMLTYRRSDRIEVIGYLDSHFLVVWTYENLLYAFRII